MSGLDRFVDVTKGAFVGRDAAIREREEGPAQRLALLEVDADDAEASTDESIWIDDTLVGFVTSGAYGHHVGKSLALAYVDAPLLDAAPELTVYIVGDPRRACDPARASVRPQGRPPPGSHRLRFLRADAVYARYAIVAQLPIVS